MTYDIKRSFCLSNLSAIDFTIKNPFFFAHWAGDNITARGDSDRITRVYPFVIIRVERGFRGKVIRDIPASHDIATTHNPAAPFSRDVLQGSNPLIPTIICWRNVDLYSV